MQRWMTAAIAGGVVGFMAGALVGRLLKSDEPKPAQIATLAEASPAPAPSRAAEPPPAGAPEPAPAAAPPAPGPTGATPSCDSRLKAALAENLRLESTVSELRAAVRAETVAKKETQGAPIPFPPDLSDAFREKQLLKTVQDALAATGVKGEVKSVDCSEFPCLVHGKISSTAGVEGTRADFGKLRAATASAYPGAEFYASYSDFLGKDGEPTVQMFTLSYYPKPTDEEQQKVLKLRVRYRKNQYVDASR